MNYERMLNYKLSETIITFLKEIFFNIGHDHCMRNGYEEIDFANILSGSLSKSENEI